MLTVFEIGCGNNPGPFYDGAMEHYISDIDSRAVTEAYKREPRFYPKPGDARRIPMDPSTIDIVLARNVFGDKYLGYDVRQRHALLRDVVHINDEMGVEARQIYKNEIDEMIYEKKSLIMHEIGRVLRVGGELMVVEQQTPRVARDFFEAFEADKTVECSFQIQEFSDLSERMPLTYAATHEINERTTLWVATKN
jgi:hypothetical protein